FAKVKILSGAKNDILVIPTEALIRTGTQQRVIVASGEGQFAARAVSSGIESGDYIEVLSGLDEHEQVVVSGQFLIDSEASLRASLLRMSVLEATPAEADK
ncbi:MAG: efflux RND transporter periplasmic adaptor subunit, partial [SAR324 cluster bacterium]